YGTAAPSSYRRDVLQHIPDRIEDWEGFSLPLIQGDATVFAVPIEMPSAAADPSGRLMYTFTAKRAFQLTGGPTSPLPTFIAVGTMGQNGLPALSSRSFRSQPHAIGVSPLDLQHVAVAANAGNLEITTNGGALWTQRNLTVLVPGWIGFNA